MGQRSVSTLKGRASGEYEPEGASFVGRLGEDGVAIDG